LTSEIIYENFIKYSKGKKIIGGDFCHGCHVRKYMYLRGSTWLFCLKIDLRWSFFELGLQLDKKGQNYDK
jgi:hypothetical protein